MSFKISRVTTDVIDDGVITNDKLADMAARTIKANPTSALATPQDVAVSPDSLLGRVGSGDLVSTKVVEGLIDTAAVTITKIATSAVSEQKIAANAVTNEKLSDMVHGSLKGNSRNTGSLDPEDIVLSTHSVLAKPSITNTLASVQLISGQVLAHTGTILEGSQVKTVMLEDASVTTAKIAPQAVDNTRLAFMSNMTVKANILNIVGEPTDIAIASNEVLGNPTGVELASTKVLTAMIADKAITNAKLADSITGNSVKARIGAGAGVWDEIAIGGDRLLGRLPGLPLAALTATEVRTMLNVEDGANAYVHPNHTGDVTSVGDGAQTISEKAVTNEMLADGSGAAAIKSFFVGFGWVDVTSQANSVLGNVSGSLISGLTLQGNSYLGRPGTGSISGIPVDEDTVIGRETGGILSNLDMPTLRAMLGLSTAVVWRTSDASVDLNSVAGTDIPFDTLDIEIDPNGVFSYNVTTHAWTFNELGVYEYTGQVVYFPSNPNQVVIDIQADVTAGVMEAYGYKIQGVFNDEGTENINVYFTGIFNVTTAPATFTMQGIRTGGTGTANTTADDTKMDIAYSGEVD